MKKLLLFLVILSVLVAGCSQSDPLAGYCADDEKPVVVCEKIDMTTTNFTEDTSEPTEIVIGEDTTEVTTTTEKPKEDFSNIEYAAEREYMEGDLVSFAFLKTADPDNDAVTITFSEPLDEKGEWQTKTGDVGEYTVKITASDGKAESTEYVLVKILKKNSAPVLEVPEKITITESEEVVIDATATDEDNDEIAISFSGWMDAPRYTTNYNDAGEHNVKVTASDGTNEVSKDVKVIVLNKNRAPVLEEPNYDVVAMEGELVELSLSATDEDGDIVTLSYSEPFDATGKWQTGEGDAGTYTITVTASDGTDTSSVDVVVVVQGTNTAPVMEEIAPITVDEGETVTINVVASDADGDALTTTFNGWMTSDTYTTTYTDAGEHVVTVTVSDGQESVSQDVVITVNDVNRPPEFVWD